MSWRPFKRPWESPIGWISRYTYTSAKIAAYIFNLWIFNVFLSCFCYASCARLFICALWSPAWKGLTSWLSLVVYKCELVTFPLVSWVRCRTWLYRFLICAPLLTLFQHSWKKKINQIIWFSLVGRVNRARARFTPPSTLFFDLYKWGDYWPTVKPVLSGHSKIDKTKILMTNDSLMKVESIAECSLWSILQYFWPALSDNRYWKPIFVIFWRGRLRQVFLYFIDKMVTKVMYYIECTTITHCKPTHGALRIFVIPLSIWSGNDTVTIVGVGWEIQNGVQDGRHK